MKSVGLTMFIRTLTPQLSRTQSSNFTELAGHTITMYDADYEYAGVYGSTWPKSLGEASDGHGAIMKLYQLIAGGECYDKAYCHGQF